MHQRTCRLGYALNAFPYETLDGMWDVLKNKVPEIKKRVFGDDKFYIELRLSQKIVDELAGSDRILKELRDFLFQHNLALITLNAFVPLTFHEGYVKERVYLPNWHEGEERVTFTKACIDILAFLAPEDETFVSLSVPGGILKTYLTETNKDQIHSQIAVNMTRCVLHAYETERKTGKRCAIGMEPEPGLTYERIPEVREFFTNYVDRVGAEFLAGQRSNQEPDFSKDSKRLEEAKNVIHQFLGVTFDTCHQLVQYEDLIQSVQFLQQSRIKIFKVQVSNAIQVDNPLKKVEDMEVIEKYFMNSRFLHQVVGINAERKPVIFSLDLPYLFTPEGKNELARRGVTQLRTHYHVPVFENPQAGIQTTIQELKNFLREFIFLPDPGDNPSSKILGEEVPLIIETYTWVEQIAHKAGTGTGDLSTNIANELEYVRRVLEEKGFRCRS
ncbi:MAG TPA: metabolite traffic protein EboE [Candidatus Limnocylindrales bacterium]|nr:metabolite traffic protein EboE [Candidatus Limnocylindrales bacterium]